MKEETLRKEHFKNKLTQQEIAKKYGTSRQRVNRYFQKYRISPLKTYERNEAQELTERQMNFMIGTMFGDGCLTLVPNGVNAYLAVKHCMEQRKYVEWKRDMMAGFVNCDIKSTMNTGFGVTTEQLYFRTICHPIFSDLHTMFYDSGVKVVTNEVIDLLTPLGLATWLMDDGFRSRNHLVFSTQSFTEEELHRIQEALKKKFNLYTTLWFSKYRKGNNQKMYNLGILRKSILDILDIIEPHIIPSMYYKIEPLIALRSGTSETTRGTPPRG